MNMNMIEENNNRLKAQREEFVALSNLSEAYNCMPTVVSDEYGEARYHFERALTSFIEAMKANKRFEPGNRYGLTSVTLASPTCVKSERTVIETYVTHVDSDGVTTELVLHRRPAEEKRT